jgi:prepilin-type N-terminal cleavage/methylation domain-containing protein
MRLVAVLLLNHGRTMVAVLRNARGFSLIELLLTVAMAATLLAISVPALMDVNDNSKLSAAARSIERELHSARLRAVTNNRSVRVRLNCPAAGYFRTVEVLGTAADDSANRCLTTAYPFPPDTDLMTRPNYDGPPRVLPNGATVTEGIFEFRPDGTAYTVVGGAAQVMPAPVTVTVTRNGRTKAMTINGSGKILYQQ